MTTKWSCHTYPNDKLLQLMVSSVSSTLTSVVIPIQTISFYNRTSMLLIATTTSCHTYPNDKLLQPHQGWCPRKVRSCHTYPNDKLLQRELLYLLYVFSSCHTYPNDKLLQLPVRRISKSEYAVVIPIQTISFYNKSPQVGDNRQLCCHTYPNDKLLQQNVTKSGSASGSCHTYPNDKLLQPYPTALTRGDVLLSYLSKR